MLDFFSKKQPVAPTPIPDDHTVTANELNFTDGPSLDYLSKLVRGMAHKHNNSLTVTQGYADLLLSNPEGQDPRPGLTAISQIARNTASFNARIIACASNDKPNLKPIDLSSFLNNRIHRYDDFADNKPLTIEVHPAAPSPKVTTDILWLDQILDEILLNACQASGTRRIQVSLAAPPTTSSLQIIIKDDGEGIPIKDLPQVFDPFFSRKGHENVGIGLTRAGFLAGKMGVTLTLTSNDGGTTIVVTVPQ